MPGAAGPTWSIVAIHLLVGHRHDRMLELFPEVCDGLVDQEDSHRHEQQVDEDEQDREDILQAGLAEADAARGRLVVHACRRDTSVTRAAVGTHPPCPGGEANPHHTGHLETSTPSLPAKATNITKLTVCRDRTSQSIGFMCPSPTQQHSHLSMAAIPRPVLKSCHSPLCSGKATFSKLKRACTRGHLCSQGCVGGEGFPVKSHPTWWWLQQAGFTFSRCFCPQALKHSALRESPDVAVALAVASNRDQTVWSHQPPQMATKDLNNACEM